MNNLIKNKSDKMSLHEHKIVSSIENNGINLTNLIYAMNGTAFTSGRCC